MTELKESTKTVNDLLASNYSIQIENYKGHNEFTMYLVEPPEQNPKVMAELIVDFYKNVNNIPLYNIHSQLEPEVRGGWGPLLYDLAAEYVYHRVEGAIIPSICRGGRNYTTPAAQKIWKYYRDNRTDVKIFKLDIKDINFDLEDDDPDICIAVQKKSKRRFHQLKSTNKIKFSSVEF